MVFYVIRYYSCTQHTYVVGKKLYLVVYSFCKVLANLDICIEAELLELCNADE